MTQNALALTTGHLTKPQEITNALAEAWRSGAVVVAPGGTTECVGVPEGHGVVITRVQPLETDMYKERSSGAICYHARFLKKLAAGLGLEWIPSETRRLDNFSDPFLCAITVAGRYRDYSGEWRVVTGSAQLDLRDGAEHGCTPKELKRKRGKIQEFCETMAKSRAIADASVQRSVAKGDDPNAPIICAKLFRKDPLEGERTAAEAALWGPSASESSTEEPRQVEAAVRDADCAAQPQSRRAPEPEGVDQVIRLPDSSDYGDDAGKPIGDAKPGSLAKFYRDLHAWLTKPDTAQHPQRHGAQKRALLIIGLVPEPVCSGLIDLTTGWLDDDANAEHPCRGAAVQRHEALFERMSALMQSAPAATDAPAGDAPPGM